MAQKTWVTGETITGADINTYLTGEGGAWTTWTPTLTQSGAVAATVTRAVYARYGRTIIYEVLLSVTGSGTAANDVTISLPVTAAYGNNSLGGYGEIYDASANITYHGPAFKASTTTVKIRSASGSATGALGSSSFTAALAAGDAVLVTGTYEAAS